MIPTSGLRALRSCLTCSCSSSIHCANESSASPPYLTDSAFYLSIPPLHPLVPFAVITEVLSPEALSAGAVQISFTETLTVSRGIIDYIGIVRTCWVQVPSADVLSAMEVLSTQVLSTEALSTEALSTDVLSTEVLPFIRPPARVHTKTCTAYIAVLSSNLVFYNTQHRVLLGLAITRAASANQKVILEVPREKPEEWQPCLLHMLKHTNRVKHWWIPQKTLVSTGARSKKTTRHIDCKKRRQIIFV